MENFEVLILAGGKGTRLQSVVSDLPKPMAPIGGLPFLEYQIKFLKKFGLEKVCFLTGYKAECVEDYFGNGESWGIETRYSAETEPLGTGGAIKLAVEKSNSDHFICLNGDSLFTCDIKKLLEGFEVGQTSLALKEMHNFDRYGVVITDETGNVLSFEEKKFQEAGWINAGIYAFERSLAEKIPAGFVSLENEIFPLLSAEKKLRGVKLGGDFIDIGIPEDFERGQTLIPKWI